MDFSFFRRQETLDDADILADDLLEDTAQVVAVWQDAVVSNVQAPVPDPARNAAYIRIGLVSVEDNVQLPALLHDVSQSALVQRIRLPRNPRIAADELYELDGMDYIVMLMGNDKRISKDTVRWLKRLKNMRIPMVVLLPYAVKKRHERHQVDVFSRRVGAPVVSVPGDNVDEAREQLVMTTMQFMPAMGLALAAHLPSFRNPLMHTLLENATSESLSADGINNIQLQLVRQICAAHGFTEHEFEKHQVAMETLVKSTSHYTGKIVRPFLFKDEQRRNRFNNALSTLLVGHATAMYLGAEPPPIRKELIPQIWRLYRASKQAV